MRILKSLGLLVRSSASFSSSWYWESWNACRVPQTSSPSSATGCPHWPFRPQMIRTLKDLAHLNAVMSRLDLICKLISPIFMSYVVTSTKSAEFGPFVMVTLNVITWPVEYWTARQVYNANRSLQEPKLRERRSKIPVITVSERNGQKSSKASTRAWEILSHIAFCTLAWVRTYLSSLEQYFSTEVWMPSLAMTSLHFSVLVFSGILTVFLLQSGFSAKLIMWGEVFSAIFELSSTYIFAWGVRFFSVRRDEYITLRGLEDFDADSDSGAADDATKVADQKTGASKLGFWALVQVFLVLVRFNAFPFVLLLAYVVHRSPQYQQYGNSPASSPKTPTPTLSKHLRGRTTSLLPFS